MNFSIVDNLWIFILLIVIGMVIVLAWISTKVDMSARQIRTIVYISDNRNRFNSSSVIHVQRFNRYNVTALIAQSIESNDTVTTNRSSETSSEIDKTDSKQSISDRTHLETDDDSLPSKEISIRIKHLDEKESNVITLDTQTILDFKKDNFSDQLSRGRTVRLIYNGQELKESNSTLREYGVKDKSTIHCLIVSPKTTDYNSPHSESSDANSRTSTTTETPTTDIEIRTLLFPLVGVIIILLWYIRICYRHYFNVITTFGLIGATVIYLISCITCFNITNHLLFHNRGNHHHRHHHHHHHHLTHNHHNNNLESQL